MINDFVFLKNSDLASKPYLFKNKTLMLIHGSGDNNVHFQNTMALVEALQGENILFNQQVYPDSSHEFTSTRGHLFRAMLDFWIEDCFVL
jgi:dipeptidyl aminopeptidase/acylaminoacyl peptidase